MTSLNPEQEVAPLTPEQTDAIARNELAGVPVSDEAMRLRDAEAAELRSTFGVKPEDRNNAFAVLDEIGSQHLAMHDKGSVVGLTSLPVGEQRVIAPSLLMQMGQNDFDKLSPAARSAASAARRYNAVTAAAGMFGIRDRDLINRLDSSKLEAYPMKGDEERSVPVVVEQTVDTGKGFEIVVRTVPTQEGEHDSTVVVRHK